MRLLFIFLLVSISSLVLYSAETVHISSSRTLSIPYTVTDAEGSSIKDVELWFTMDAGKTWRLAGTDPDQKSPVEYTVPSDGLFGFFVVSVDKHGNREASPKGGAAPQVSVLVDTIAPKVQVITPSTDKVMWKGGEKHAITWNASDENLLEKPISIEYSIDAGRTWEVIVRKTENTGRFLWSVPQVDSDSCLVRIVCMDTANNFSKAVSTNPFLIYTGTPKIRREISLPKEKARAEHIYQFATVLRLRGEYRKSIVEYKKVLNIIPDSTKALNDMALAYVSIEQFKTAQTILEQAAQLETDDTDIVLNLARVYLKQDKDNKAFAILNKLLKQHPANEEALWYLSLLYEERKNYVQAKTLWKEIVSSSLSYSKRRLMAQDKISLYSDIKE